MMRNLLGKEQIGLVLHIILMDYELIDTQLQELQSSAHVESVKQISDNSYQISYAPQLNHSPYSNILFSLKITFPEQYPQSPPFLAFQDKIYHLNIDPVSGKVNMPIIREDWSPFLTVTDVFNSLNSVLEEPELDSAANDTIKSEYVNEPEKYMKKVTQLANLYTEPKGNDNQSEVEHVEEIVEFREEAYNHNFDKEKERPEVANLKESLPFSQIPKNSKESLDTPEKNEIRIEDDSEEHVEIKVNNHKEAQSPKREVLKVASKKSPEKKLQMTESFVCEQKEQFQQIQASLKKSDQLIEVLLLGCESMQQTLQASKNARIRQLLEKRLQSQWKMVEQLLEMTSRLKQKLFTSLKNQTNQLLK